MADRFRHSPEHHNRVEIFADVYPVKRIRDTKQGQLLQAIIGWRKMTAEPNTSSYNRVPIYVCIRVCVGLGISRLHRKTTQEMASRRNRLRPVYKIDSLVSDSYSLGYSVSWKLSLCVWILARCRPTRFSNNSLFVYFHRHLFNIDTSNISRYTYLFNNDISNCSKRTSA